MHLKNRVSCSAVKVCNTTYKTITLIISRFSFSSPFCYVSKTQILTIFGPTFSWVCGHIRCAAWAAAAAAAAAADAVAARAARTAGRWRRPARPRRRRCPLLHPNVTFLTITFYEITWLCLRHLKYTQSNWKYILPAFMTGFIIPGFITPGWAYLYISPIFCINYKKTKKVLIKFLININKRHHYNIKKVHAST